MFEFIKKSIFVGLTILSSVNQKLLMLIVMSLCFNLLVLKQVNAVIVVTISMIHM